MAEPINFRRPRSQSGQSVVESCNPQPETLSTVAQSSISCKSTISSILVSGDDYSTPRLGSVSMTTKKKNNFSSAAFRRMGCKAAAPSEVSVPAAIRVSADWERKCARRKKKEKEKLRSDSDGSGSGGVGCMVVEEAWCGHGIGFSPEASSVDCVVSRRSFSSSVRGEIDEEQLNQRERSSCLARRAADPDNLSCLDSEPLLLTARPVSSDVQRRKYYRHARHPSPEGLAEVMLFQNSLWNGGRLDSLDHFSNWRLDVDEMTYEELLELGEKIGYVNTGLKEDDIFDCVTKTKITQMDWKCSICQEEWESTGETGKLECGHVYHLQCIKQWLTQKNSCPVCKIAAKC